ncbi:phage tail tape measure C-terminal domain-containing protein [Roseovarius sp. MS2]|uniref:phage tail tape measure C-terminal domain-containing protein n=1 Tax=Roseovarius sp. MS2 TaxID=3390728 RepID=UPI003EDC3675
MESLGDEERQLKRLIKEMNNRTFSLGVENEALQLVISGQASSVEVGKLMVAAQREGAGVIDGQTAAMIRQYDAAQQLNKELQSAATQGAKAWLDAVPSYAEAGRIIEEDVLDSLSAGIAEFAKTGKLDFERLADSILNTMADLAAKLAVKELFGDALSGGDSGGGFLAGLFGGGDGGGGFLAGLFGAGSEGGYSGNLPGRAVAPISAFRQAPHFSEGTANTSGIPAILHDNEAVIPLSKGRKVPVEVNGGTSGGAAQMLNYSPTYNIQTPDADSFRRSQNQTAADGLSAAQRALRKNG